MSEALAEERIKSSLLEDEGLLRVEVDNPKGNILDAATMSFRIAQNAATGDSGVPVPSIKQK